MEEGDDGVDGGCGGGGRRGKGGEEGWMRKGKEDGEEDVVGREVGGWGGVGVVGG